MSKQSKKEVSVEGWHPLLQQAHNNLHPTVLINYRDHPENQKMEQWHYGNAVCSVVFDWLDQGLPPFMHDIAQALTAEGILKPSGSPYVRQNIRQVINNRGLWRHLVAYRRTDNLGYIRGISVTGAGRKTQWYVPG